MKNYVRYKDNGHELDTGTSLGRSYECLWTTPIYTMLRGTIKNKRMRKRMLQKKKHTPNRICQERWKLNDSWRSTKLFLLDLPRRDTRNQTTFDRTQRRSTWQLSTRDANQTRSLGVSQDHSLTCSSWSSIFSTSSRVSFPMSPGSFYTSSGRWPRSLSLPEVGSCVLYGPVSSPLLVEWVSLCPF